MIVGTSCLVFVARLFFRSSRYLLLLSHTFNTIPPYHQRFSSTASLPSDLLAC